jgi:hypothetical protein
MKDGHPEEHEEVEKASEGGGGTGRDDPCAE